MITLTMEERLILLPEYHRYCENCDDDFPPISFDDWWRDAADAAKDRAKYAGK